VSNFVELGSSGVVCLCLCPKMMSDGQYYGRLSSRYISHSDRHVGHRLDLDKFGKGRDDWRCRSGAQVGSVELRRVRNRAPAQILSSRLSLAHCGRYADRAAVYSFSTLNERGWTTNHDGSKFGPGAQKKFERTDGARSGTHRHITQSTPKLPASMGRLLLTWRCTERLLVYVFHFLLNKSRDVELKTV
jgi:hypothetical protein